MKKKYLYRKYKYIQAMMEEILIVRERDNEKVISFKDTTQKRIKRGIKNIARH